MTRVGTEVFVDQYWGELEIDVLLPKTGPDTGEVRLLNMFTDTEFCSVGVPCLSSTCSNILIFTFSWGIELNLFTYELGTRRNVTAVEFSPVRERHPPIGNKR